MNSTKRLVCRHCGLSMIDDFYHDGVIKFTSCDRAVAQDWIQPHKYHTYAEVMKEEDIIDRLLIKYS